MRNRTKKSLRASLALMLALVMLFGAVPLNAIAKALDDYNNVDSYEEVFVPDPADPDEPDPYDINQNESPEGEKPGEQDSVEGVDVSIVNEGGEDQRQSLLGRVLYGARDLLDTLGGGLIRMFSNSDAQGENDDSKEYVAQVDTKAFTWTFNAALGGQVADVRGKLEVRGEDGGWEHVKTVPTDDSGVMRIYDMRDDGKTRYRLTLIMPNKYLFLDNAAVDYLRERGFLRNFMIDVDGSMQYPLELDLNEIENKSSQGLTVLDKEGRVEIKKTYADEFTRDVFIGIAPAGSQEIIWYGGNTPTVISGPATFTIEDFVKSDVAFNNQGRITRNSDLDFNIYEFAPADTIPTTNAGLRYQRVNDNRYIRPEGVPIDYVLWRSPAQFTIPGIRASETIHNIEYEFKFYPETGVTFGGTADLQPMRARIHTWSVEKTGVGPAAPIERGDSFDIYYTVVFRRAGGEEVTNVLAITRASVTLLYDELLGQNQENYFRGEIMLQRRPATGGAWVTVSTDEQFKQHRHYLSAGVITEGDNLRLTLPFILRDTDYKENYQYQLRLDGTFNFRIGGGDWQEVSFTNKVAALGGINAPIGEGGGSNAQDARIGEFEDEFTVGSHFAVTDITNVQVNGFDRQDWSDTTRLATEGIWGMPGIVLPSGDTITVTYTATFEDRSWLLEPCADNYDIVNTATATTNSTGFPARDSATVEVEIPKYSILSVEKTNQTGLNDDGTPRHGSGKGRVFHLYEGGNKVAEGKIDDNNRLMFSKSGTVASDLDIPSGLTRVLVEDIRLKPNTTYRIYEIGTPEGMRPLSQDGRGEWVKWQSDTKGFYLDFKTGDCGHETVTVRNEYQGRLTVGKVVQSVSGAVMETWPVDAKFEITIAGVGGTETEGFIRTVTLTANNRSEMLNNLKPGQYIVTETGGYEGYEVTITNNGDINVTITAQTVTVTNRQNAKGLEIVITANSDSKVFDGTALTNIGWKAAGVPDGYEVRDVVVEGTVTNVVDSPVENVVRSHKIYRISDDMDVTAYFTNYRYEKGELKITPRPANMTANFVWKWVGDEDPAFSATPEMNDPDNNEQRGFLSNHAPATTTYNVTRPGAGIDEAPGLYEDALEFSNITFNNPNYDVRWIPGNFWINANNPAFTNITIIVRGNSRSFVYNGEEQSVSGYTVNNNAPLPAGFRVEAQTSDPSAENVAQTPLPNMVSDVRVYFNNVDVTAIFNNPNMHGTLVINHGLLTIIPRPAIVTADFAYKYFAQNDPVFTATAEGPGMNRGFLKNDAPTATQYEVYRQGAGTDEAVGMYNNALGFRNITFADTNYSVAWVRGNFEIKRNLDLKDIKIIVEGNSTTRIFNGEEHTASGFVFKSADETSPLPPEITVYAETTDPTGINVVPEENESRYNIVSDVVIRANGIDVTNMVSYETINGELVIRPRPANVTVDNAEKFFADPDPTPFTATAEEAGKDRGFLAGDAPTDDMYKIDRSNADIEEVGTYPGVLRIVIKNISAGGFNNPNYDVSWFHGDFTIKDGNPKFDISIIVRGNSNTQVFNGKEHTASGATATLANGASLPPGFTFTADTTNPRATRVVETLTPRPNTVSNERIYYRGFDVTDSIYSLQIIHGELKITPRPANITADFAWKWVGNADPRFSATLEMNNPDNDEQRGFLLGNVPTMAQREIFRTNFGLPGGEDVKLHEGVLDFKHRSSLNPLNYDITWVVSDFEIRANNPAFENITITVRGSSDSFVFNGEEQFVSGYTVNNGEELPKGFVVRAQTSDPSATNAMQTPLLNTVSNVRIYFNNVDVTEVFDNPDMHGTLIIKHGSLTITPRPANMTADFASKLHMEDDPSFTATAEVATGDSGFLANDAPTSDMYTIIRTNLDEPNGEDVKLHEGVLVFRNQTFNDPNYDVSWIPGNFEIHENPVFNRTIIVRGDSDTQVYDGTQRHVLGATVDDLDIHGEAGFRIIKTISGASATDVNTEAPAQNTIERVTVMYNSRDVTDYVNVRKYHGLLTITPRPITITAASAEKAYDGIALTDAGYEITSVLDLAEGHEFYSVAVEGSQLNVGSSENVVGEVVIHDANDIDVTANYAITFINGTLTITPVPVIPGPDPGPDPEPDPDIPPPIIVTAQFDDDDDDDDDTIVIASPAVPHAPAPELAETPVEPPQVPAPTVVIEDPAVPLAPFSDGLSWALWNLILSVLGAALALVMGIRALIKQRRANEEDEEQLDALHAEHGEVDEIEKGKRGRLALILAIPLLAIIGIILFILTQDMRLPMVMTDWWTVAHAILFAGGILCYIFAYKKDKGGDSDDEEPAPSIGTA